MTSQPSASTYIVPMFPYPSGRLHMGHVRNYAISDAIARHYRRQGARVLHPIGWDAFGLPAENAARERGADPRGWTDENIRGMRQQLEELGFEFSAGHEIATHHPGYMALGQSIFLRFYSAGLIERRSGEVWWDPIDNTVLANEQVVDGRGWRSGAVAERRTLSMLFARTRDRAQALTDGLDALAWPSQAKAAQRAWIGVDGDDIRLHDWCLSRQRCWGTPVPLVQCEDCGEVPVNESDLPLPNLPTHPTREDVAIACPRCERTALRSTETLDTFWDSSFYHCVYPDAVDNRATQVAGEAYRSFAQVDLYIGGLEHATMHLLYARWFAWAMGQVGFDVPEEPFKRLIGQGMVCAPAYKNDQGQWVAPGDVVVDGTAMTDPCGRAVEEVGTVKMSKSKKNGVDPGEQVRRFGAEAVRFAMLFAAPYHMEIDWRADVVGIAARHIQRMISQAPFIAGAPAGERVSDIERRAEALRQQARCALEGMEGVNASMGAALGLWRDAFGCARRGNGASARIAMRAVADSLWPMIPKTMETVMGHIEPNWAPAPIEVCQVATFNPLVFQVNGVRRGCVDAKVDSGEDALEWIKSHRPEIARQYLTDEIVKIVFVPGRVVNIATKKPKPGPD